MARNYRRGYRSHYSRTAAAPESAPAPQTEEQRLLEAATLASKARNDLHWSLVADFSWSDKKPGDATRRKIAHYTRLIQLVGDADTAWRAYRTFKGEEYTSKNAPPDLGWMPRYTQALEQLRSQLAAELVVEPLYGRHASEAPSIQRVESEVFSILKECAQ